MRVPVKFSGHYDTKKTNTPKKQIGNSIYIRIISFPLFFVAAAAINISKIGTEYIILRSPSPQTD